jgi:clan AA aspartic protease
MMGLVYANIQLANAGEIYMAQLGYLPPEAVKRTVVHALVNTGAYMLAINETVRSQLNLPKVDEQLAELADGSHIYLDLVGPVEVRFENRRANVDAMVLPGDSEVLLGAIPMEDLDVLVDPKRQQLIVNPESPEIARKSLK